MKSYFVYEFSYPEGMPGSAGIVFYVGKGTSLTRMDAHLTEASGGCPCDKCSAIRSVWDAGLIVVRRIVFESVDEQQVLHEETARIKQHHSPHLTNIVGGWRKRKIPVSPVKETCGMYSVPDPRSFVEDGETWVRTTDAFLSAGTELLHKAHEYGVSRQVRGSTTYYRKSELPAFYAWVRPQYPYLFTH